MPMYSACGGRRITGAGFSHSEIHGSKAVQRLTVAYRSRPRPSSSPGAKASTVCPYYLDGELLTPALDGLRLSAHPRMMRARLLILHAPPPMSVGKRKERPRL